MKKSSTLLGNYYSLILNNHNHCNVYRYCHVKIAYMSVYFGNLYSVSTG